MKKTLSLLLLLFSAANAQREAYVVNTFAETLSQIDLETGAVENHIVTLGETPNQAVFFDGFVYVVNSISADIMKIDPQSRQVVADIELPIGSNPYYVAVNNDYCFVTGFVSGSVYKIDLSTNSINGELNLGEFPEGVLYDDGHVYVTLTAFNPDDYSYGQGKIVVIDNADLSEVTRVNIGKNPQWISKAPDGNLHIVCTGSYAESNGSVYIFDTGSNTVSDSILIGGQPANLAISPTGIGYLAAGGWFDHGEVYSYDTESGEILHGPSNPIHAGLGVTAVAADSLGNLYTCDMGDDTVSKFSTSGNFERNFGVGDGPISITISDEIIVDIDPDSDPNLPVQIALLDIYPNPFNSRAAIKYSLPNGVTNSKIEIYNILGNRVNSIDPGTDAMSGVVYWNGMDRQGNDCPSGVYFARIVAEQEDGQSVETGNVGKMTLLR